MAQRREREPVKKSGEAAIGFRLPDGTTLSVPLKQRPAVCCFCGGEVAVDAPDHVTLSAAWNDGGSEQSRSWDAHRGCLADQQWSRAGRENPGGTT
jgi:hypothetical protein